MPVRNEADHLDAAVAAVLAQDYPGDCQVVPGGRAEHATAPKRSPPTSPPPTTTCASCANPTRHHAGRAQRGDPGEHRRRSIVRVDGHAELSPGYIRRAVETLRRTGAVNVGGIQRAVGTTPFEQAVADGDDLAVRHRRRRRSTTAAPRVRPTPCTSACSIARRSRRSGCSTSGCVRNQDYELNIRLRAGRRRGVVRPAAGGRRTGPRGSLRALARQYFEYGRWKRAVVRRAPAVAALAPGGAAAGHGRVVAACDGGRAWRAGAALPCRRPTPSPCSVAAT